MTYTADFFAANTEVGLRSARIVLPGVLDRTHARTVADVGCASGAWLTVAKGHGCTIRGFDGNVPDDQLLISPDEFERCDLAEGVDCSGFDLALCLEVAEHLPEAVAPALVAGLCKARFVLFSPAIPGQRGVGHVNEQWSTWWEPLFNAHGYFGSCDLRWKHWADRDVCDFYRQNMLVFSTPARLHAAGYRPGVVDVVHPERLHIW